MSIASYRELRVWQKAIDLAETTYRSTSSFPASETYGLTSQMRRSVVSIAANIAEGYGRGSAGLYASFLKMARGSLLEFETHVVIASRVGLITGDAAAPLNESADSIGRMLSALIRSVESRGRATANKTPNA